MPTYQVLGLPRNPIGVALKDVLTLGIWGKFWLVRINRELDGHERFHIDFRRLWVLVLLPLVTPIVVKWKTLHRLHKALRHQVTLSPPNYKLLFLISLVPVLGTLTWVAWTQSLLNRHWLWHKRDERIEAKANRIAELRPHAGEPKTHARIATLEAEVRELEAQRKKELAAAESRRRVRDGKAQARAGRPRRSLIPVKLGRTKKEETAQPEAPATEERPARKLSLPFLRKKKAPSPEAPPAPDEGVAAPAGELSPKDQRKLDKRRAKEEAKRAKFEAKAAKTRAKEEAKAAKRAEKEAKKRATEGEPEPPARIAPPAPPAPASAPVPVPAPVATTQTQASAGGQVTKTAEVPVGTSRRGGGFASSSAVKVLTLRCPQCQTRIEGIRKVAGEATPVECPSCHFKASV